MENIKILVCGDRNWTNEERMATVLRRTLGMLWNKKGNPNLKNTLGFDPNLVELVHGCATGADTMSEKVAIDRLKIPEANIKRYPAPWDDIEGKSLSQIGTRQDGSKYWMAAGPYRNEIMSEEKPDLCIAFHNDINHSKGTKNMIDICVRKHIPYLIFSTGDVM